MFVNSLVIPAWLPRLILDGKLGAAALIRTLIPYPYLDSDQARMAPWPALWRMEAERPAFEGRINLSEQVHSAAPHHLPFFIPGADGSDTLMVVMGLFLVATILWVGTLYWKLHSLPERMAHKTHKLQFEIVAVLGLISLFTHLHIFWIAGLLLAMIDLPDFGTPIRSIADSVERIADATPGAPAAAPDPELELTGDPEVKAAVRKEVHGHA
jgi:hypothetical protein